MLQYLYNTMTIKSVALNTIFIKIIIVMQTDRLLGDSFQEQGNDAVQMETSAKPETQVESRPFLIYNKVSAVINESKNVSSNPMKDAARDEVLAEAPVDKEPKTGSPIWYEYGCV